MRQFIFASALGTDAGKIGFSEIKNDGTVANLTATAGANVVRGNFILYRDKDKGGNILYPFYNNNFSYVKAVTANASAFVAQLVVSAAATENGTYTIVFAKKGTKFNERNKWSASVYVKKGTSAADIAKALRDQITTAYSNIFKVEGTGTTVKVTALEKGVDWAMLGADELMGTNGTVSTKGATGFVDVDYIKDLAAKCIADLGYDSTYVDDNVYLLPGSENIGNPKDVAPVAGTDYTLFTLRFAEPREVKTRDEVVNQIIQICVPSSAASGVENILKTIDGTYAAAQPQVEE